MSPTAGLAQAGAVDQVANSLVRFFPRLFWSVLVLVVGVGVAIVVSSRAEDVVEDSSLVADRLAGPFAFGVRLLLYFFAVTIALGELGLQTGVLVVFLDGVAFGLGVAVALSVGIAVGWGSRDHVAEHLAEWIDVVTADGADGGADGADEGDDDEAAAGDDAVEDDDGPAEDGEGDEAAGDDT